jgi:hypothetical protein
MHRSIVIAMVRRDGQRELRRLDKDHADTKADLNIAYRMMFAWARDAELNSDPAMPVQLRNRPADNWRPLIAIADASPGQRGRERRPLPSPASTRMKMPLSSCSAIFATSSMGVGSIACPVKQSSTASTMQTMRCGRSGVASTAISSRASCRKVNWQSCWSRFKYGRGPSGHHPTPPVNQRQKDTIGRSSRRHGVRTAKPTSRRHNREISGTCGARNASRPTTQSPPWLRTAAPARDQLGKIVIRVPAPRTPRNR